MTMIECNGFMLINDKEMIVLESHNGSCKLIRTAPLTMMECNGSIVNEAVML